LSILSVKNLHKVYDQGKVESLHVLKGIDLEVAEGEIIAIVGPSGVGKSTLLHCVGLLDRPSDGSVLIDGNDMYKRGDDELAQVRSRTVGFVFQAHHLLPDFTALENTMIPGMVAGFQNAAIEKRARQLLNAVGLEDRLEHRPNELSGGEAQRVAVARALINAPRLLLADEPSGNLDMRSADALHELLWQVSRQQKLTLIIVTHNLELAGQADRIIELYDGTVRKTTRNGQ